MEEALEQLMKVDLTATKNKSLSSWRSTFIKTQEQLDYAFKLQSELSKLKDIDIRVETPWITVYSNDIKQVNALAKIDNTNVKYISQPATNAGLAAGTVVMPKMDYDYRVTLGKTTQDHPAFIAWAESNKKLKLTKSCIRDLSKTRSWGGTHFYVTGDNNLLMVKMHLGGGISKIERIVKN